MAEERVAPAGPARELKEAREALGLSQGELARVLEVQSDRTIRKWEQRERDVPGPALVLLRLLKACPPARKLLGIGTRAEMKGDPEAQ